MSVFQDEPSAQGPGAPAGRPGEPARGVSAARPGLATPAPPSAFRLLFLDDAPARLFPGWPARWIPIAVAAVHVVVCLAFAAEDVAVPLALLPLVLAAVFLPAVPAFIVAGATFATAIGTELLVPIHPAPTLVEGLELVGFGGVALVLRLAVARHVLGREALTRGAAALAIAEAEVEAERVANEGWVAQLEAVQRMAARLTRQPTLLSVGQAIVDETRSIIDYHNCRVYLVEPPDVLLPIVAAGRVGTYESIPLEVLRTRVGQGFSGWVAAHGEAILIPDANADPRGATIPGTTDVDESMLVVPMRHDERVIGVITLSKLGLRQFDAGHLRLLTILADHAATAVESVRSLDRARHLATELSQVVAMSSALSRSLDPRRVADLIAEHMARALGAVECAISDWDRAGDRLLVLGYWPANAPGRVAPPYALDDFPATRRVLKERVVVEVGIDDPAADPAEVALLRHDGHRSVVMLPLVAKDEAIGLVELYADGPLHLDEDARQLAGTMANEAAMALANARLYETARALADRDPLTGFLNHRSFHDRLGEEIVRAQRSRRALGVLMIDLDDFKLVNDTFGHLFGDQVLRWTAERIRSTLRAPDVAARYGGDEFAVILPDATADDARLAGERIVAALRSRPFQGNARGPVPIGASVGAAAFPAGGRTVRELLLAADAALYAAKGAGGGEVVAAAPTVPDGSAGRRPRRSAGIASTAEDRPLADAS